MTTIAFLPSATSTPPFQTIVNLDGVNYSLSVVWLIAAQRWYFSILDLSGNTILYAPLIGSPLNADINLTWGYFFVSTLVFRADSNQFEITP